MRSSEFAWKTGELTDLRSLVRRIGVLRLANRAGRGRLTDESLPAAMRASTPWTLVDALDSCSGSFYPVMPFVTGAIWTALPHGADDPDLLILADLPDGGGAIAATDARFDEGIEAIIAIRNARANADVRAGAWPETHFAVTEQIARPCERLGSIAG